MAYSLADFGSYTVGGRQLSTTGQPVRELAVTPTTSFHHDPNGLHFVEHAYVQYFTPTNRLDEPPIILVHGGGMTGAMWETTPDGRPGWLHHLLGLGYEVHVKDNVERGRAGWRPGLWPGVPVTRSAEEAWRLFRIGRAEDFAARKPFEGQKFPVETFEAFCRSFVPRWTLTQNPQAEALTAMVQRLGLATIIAHSQGCQTAFDLALSSATQIDRTIAIEPSGLPPADQISGDLKISLIFGDYLDADETWSELVYRTKCLTYDHPGRCKWIELVAQGLPGHSHMIMQDRGNFEALRMSIG